MARIAGKKPICSTLRSNYKDIQGIGTDPIYLRYDSVWNIIRHSIPEGLRSFLAQPVYEAEEDRIEWWTDEWEKMPERLIDLPETEAAQYRAILEKTRGVYLKAKDSAVNPNEYRILAGALKYIEDENIYCYDGKVVLVCWGMTKNEAIYKPEGTILFVSPATRYRILFTDGLGFEWETQVVEGTSLKACDAPQYNPPQGYSFKGWVPAVEGTVINKSCRFQADLQNIPFPVTFTAGEGCTLNGEQVREFPFKHILSGKDFPTVQVADGYLFDRWEPAPDANPVLGPTVFTAVAKPREKRVFNYHFDAGEFGTISEGAADISCMEGEELPESSIPRIKSDKKHKFVGWDLATAGPAYEDREIHAVYQEKTPFILPLWLRILLLVLLLILLCFLLSWLLRGCTSRYRLHAPDIEDHYELLEDDVNAPGNGYHDFFYPEDNLSGNPSLHEDAPWIGPGVDVVDGNGYVTDPVSGVPYFRPNGPGQNIRIPSRPVVPPVTDRNGDVLPYDSEPGLPDAISGRLNIYFENDDVDLDAFARDFKTVYPQDSYRIIGSDREVRWLQIEVPNSQKAEVRENLNAKLDGYRFFVVDESLFEVNARSVSNNDNPSRGWHLDAVNLKKAWTVTQGDPSVVVAVVDDGFDLQHPLLKDRIEKPYNVFTQNARINQGVGHGTHVAGIAVGNDSAFEARHVSGIAPRCRFMPIQVSNHGIVTFSSLANGIMYAIHHGADVVNVSIVTSFSGLSSIPLSVQEEISETRFLVEEKVWDKVLATARAHNCIIVFAAGNDSVLAGLPPEHRGDNAITVAAFGRDGKAAGFSNFGEKADVSAPGVDIYSSLPDGKFGFHDGTSMAAPIVTGVIALMRSRNKELTGEQIETILKETGTSLDLIGPAINAAAAVKKAKP